MIKKETMQWWYIALQSKIRDNVYQKVYPKCRNIPQDQIITFTISVLILVSLLIALYCYSICGDLCEQEQTPYNYVINV